MINIPSEYKTEIIGEKPIIKRNMMEKMGNKNKPSLRSTFL